MEHGSKMLCFAYPASNFQKLFQIINYLSELKKTLQNGKTPVRGFQLYQWEVLEKHVPHSLKLQSETRWSAKREAVAIIYKHIGKSYELELVVGNNL